MGILKVYITKTSVFKTICILSLTWILGIIIESCRPQKCPPLEHLTYSISSLQLENIDWPSGGSWSFRDSTHSISWRDYKMQISFVPHISETTAGNTGRQFSFLQTACAKEPDCRLATFKSIDSIISLKIFVDSSFGFECTSSSTDITGLFTTGMDENFNYIMVADKLKAIDYERDVPNIGLLLKFILPPPSGKHTFTIIARLADGREFEQSIIATLE